MAAPCGILIELFMLLASGDAIIVIWPVEVNGADFEDTTRIQIDEDTQARLFHIPSSATPIRRLESGGGATPAL